MAMAGNGPVNLHGTALAVDGRAVLIRGPSGSGKSDLALRAMATAPSALLPGQPVLIADDRVNVQAIAGQIMVWAPDALKGLIEVRGVGIVSVPAADRARLVLVADICDQENVPRLPETGDQVEIIDGLPTPRMMIAPLEPSAPIKLLLALTRST